jgi:hypothetical protein
MVLVLLSGCGPSMVERMAMVATTGQIAFKPGWMREEDPTGIDGTTDTFADPYASPMGFGMLTGTITWRGDPEGACMCSDDCVSSEWDSAVTGDVLLSRAPWEEGLADVRDGDTPVPSDFPDRHARFTLSGHVRSAPDAVDCDAWASFPGAEWAGTVTLEGGDLMDVAVTLGWYDGVDTYDVSIGDATLAWTADFSS